MSFEREDILLVGCSDGTLNLFTGVSAIESHAAEASVGLFFPSNQSLILLCLICYRFCDGC